MINNFEQIYNLLNFPNEDEFYFVQIIQRKKENEMLGSNNKCVKTFYFYSLESFKKKEQEIINLCNLYNARAYIHFSRRNRKIIALELLAQLANQIKLNQLEKISDLYNSIVGQNKGVGKLWVIDIDYKEYEEVTKTNEIIYNLEPIGEKVITILPTKNGYHLITKPFNSHLFNILLGDKFPEIMIHKNNPTILYVP